MSEWKNKIEGKVEEIKGKVTDDRSDRFKGKAKQALGAVQGKLSDIRESQDRDNGDERPSEIMAGEGYHPSDT